MNKFIKGLKVSFLDEFREVFPKWRMENFILTLDDENKINAFCCQVDFSKDLKDEWELISSFITAKSQILVKSNFERWNSYIIFISNDDVHKPLKYKIENNKFAFRKIVEVNVDKLKDEKFGEFIARFLNQRLLLTHITLDEYSPNSTVEPQSFSQVGNSLMQNSISMGQNNITKEKRKTWLKQTVLNEIERASNEN